MNLPHSPHSPSTVAAIAIGILVPLAVLLASRSSEPGLPIARRPTTPSPRPVRVRPLGAERRCDPTTILRVRRRLMAIDDRYDPSPAEIAAASGARLDQVRIALALPRICTLETCELAGYVPRMHTVVDEVCIAVAGVVAGLRPRPSHSTSHPSVVGGH